MNDTEHCARCGATRPPFSSRGQIVERHRPYTETVVQQWLCDTCTSGFLSYLAGGKLHPPEARRNGTTGGPGDE